ncbi:glucose 1-dehydrogenase [Jonesiaceae bacterium BS-20]|uniref:Glucose 1-dehydrogenase n=1 Tax=Jonesiaceae bacterium BS-20 TaxID=3120821 RepID=A0AAU7DRN9_9MICO
MSSFAGKVALVTGGASGIGAAVSRELGAKGACVVVTDINLDGAQGVVDEIIAAGGTAAALRQDIAVEADSKAAVEFAVATYGQLDLAVNNAGIGGGIAPIAQASTDDWRRTIDINLNGVFYGLRYQLEHMMTRGSGSVVNVSSILGTNGQANSAAYVSAKHAVVGLTKTAALEVSPHGIRVNAVGPGYINTPLLENAPQEMLDGLVGLHPAGRLGNAEEVAAIIVFLLSDEASFVTGSYHLVDGGYSAR